VAPVAFLILFVVWVSALVRLLRARRSRFIFRDGWLIVRKGIIFQEDTPYEFMHLDEAKVTRNPIDLLTGNGKLLLYFNKKQTPVVLHGVAPIDKLRQVQSDLIDLKRQLSGIQALKGLLT
jgi:hypothetical protein